MAIFLFALVSFFSDVQPVSGVLRSPGRVAVDTDTSARASSDSLDHDSRIPSVCQRHQAHPYLPYTSDELLTLDGQYVCSAQLADNVHQLSITPGGSYCCRPARKCPYRGGRRKQGRTISIIISDRPASQPWTLHPLTAPTFDSAVLYRNSLTKKIAVFTRDFVFTAFETCEVPISLENHTVEFLSVYRPLPIERTK